MTKRPKKDDKPAPLATVIIANGTDLTPSQRKDISLWIKRQARLVVKDGRDYPPNFTAHYTDERWQW